MASVSDYGTGGLGSIGNIFYSVCFSFVFSVFMLTYYILVIWNYKNDKHFHSFTCADPGIFVSGGGGGGEGGSRSVWKKSSDNVFLVLSLFYRK